MAWTCSQNMTDWSNIIQTIYFIRCLKKYKVQHQDILFRPKTRRITLAEKIKRQHEIRKKPDYKRTRLLLYLSKQGPSALNPAQSVLDIQDLKHY